MCVIAKTKMFKFFKFYYKSIRRSKNNTIRIYNAMMGWVIDGVRVVSKETLLPEVQSYDFLHTEKSSKCAIHIPDCSR